LAVPIRGLTASAGWSAAEYADWAGSLVEGKKSIDRNKKRSDNSM
jgi:hypothetical protein